LLLTAAFAGSGAVAAEAAPNLPPADVVARVLRANPSVDAARGQVRVEEANKDRLEAGSYDWNLRFGAHPADSSCPSTQRIPSE
jgi:outer membrane protein TolC